MKKFWNWKTQTVINETSGEETLERVLSINGTIAEDSWFEDDVTPKIFRDELESGSGDITVWINSPGGDCIAAAQIYNMLRDYPGKVTVKVSGLAASAASVIAVSGDQVLMSEVGMIMIHNPATIAFGDHVEMQKAIEMLESVKNSIINAYMRKTGLSRAKLSHLMDQETWMDATAALELGFIDDVIKRNNDSSMEDDIVKDAVLFSRRAVNNALLNKLEAKYGEKPSVIELAEIPEEAQVTGREADEFRARLNNIKRFI